MNLEFSRQMFEKYSNIKFRENPFSGSRVVPCGQTDGLTDMTKLILAFHNFKNASKKSPRLIIFTDILDIIENSTEHVCYGL